MGFLILLVNAAAVLFMTCFIWTMQVVHSPLFDRVGEDTLPHYETDHSHLFFRVAGPAILLTLLTAVLLLPGDDDRRRCRSRPSPGEPWTPAPTTDKLYAQGCYVQLTNCLHSLV